MNPSRFLCVHIVNELIAHFISSENIIVKSDQTKLTTFYAKIGSNTVRNLARGSCSNLSCQGRGGGGLVPFFKINFLLLSLTFPLQVGSSFLVITLQCCQSAASRSLSLFSMRSSFTQFIHLLRPMTNVDSRWINSTWSK